MTNVINFPAQNTSSTSNTYLSDIRKTLNLPECQQTKNCITSKKINVFSCKHYQECQKHKAALSILAN